MLTRVVFLPASLTVSSGDNGHGRDEAPRRTMAANEGREKSKKNEKEKKFLSEGKKRM